MTLPIYRVLPHPEGGWCFTKTKGWRWPSYLKPLTSYPSAIDAMDAAFLKPDVVTRRQVCWIARPAQSPVPVIDPYAFVWDEAPESNIGPIATALAKGQAVEIRLTLDNPPEEE